MRALEYLRSPSRIWAIDEGAWQEMVTIAGGENANLEVIEASLGKLDNKSANQIEVIDGVAVIPVIGPIVKYGTMFSNISGATSVSHLTKSFNLALEDESVKAILFEIDSPGGEANGINEFAEQIFNARGLKPVEAYISGQGCSAAYWIASACDKIWLDETAMAGSIGVAAVVKDDEDADNMKGIRTYKFVSEGSENKRPDLASDEGRQVILESLNAMAAVFRQKVARNRSTEYNSLTVRDVIDKFNRGGVLMGDAAVRAGLADGLSSYKQVLSSLVNTSGAEQPVAAQPLNFIQENIMDINTDAGAVAPVANDAEVAALEAKLAELESEKASLADQFEAIQAQLTEISATLSAEVAAKEAVSSENLQLKAEAEAARLSNKLTPAQKETFVATYVQMAKDDASNPVEGMSRLANYLGMWEANEDHGLLEEELDPEHIELPAENEEQEDEFNALTSMAVQFAKAQNKKLQAGK